MSNRPGKFLVTVNRYYVTNFRLHKEVYEQFPLFDTDRDEFISMEEYNQRTYDFIHDEEYKDSLTQEDIDHVEASNKRDIRRFLEADGNSDGQLDIVEFAAFLHPHSHDHMQDVLLMETFEEMDSNLDGKESGITFDPNDLGTFRLFFFEYTVYSAVLYTISDPFVRLIFQNILLISVGTLKRQQKARSLWNQKWDILMSSI